MFIFGDYLIWLFYFKYFGLLFFIDYCLEYIIGFYNFDVVLCNEFIRLCLDVEFLLNEVYKFKIFFIVSFLKFKININIF